MRLALLLVTTLLLALVDAARAHDPGLSSAHLTRHADRLETRLEVYDGDLAGLDLLALGPAALVLESAGDRIPAVSVEVAPTRDRHTGIHLLHPLPAGAAPSLDLALLEVLPIGHKTYLRVELPDGTTLSERILSREARRTELGAVADGAAGQGGAVWRFFALGIEHILVGFDHLLFLFVVLLGCTGLAAAARVVTAFSVAHSLSLAAAVLGWLRPPADVVEPLIAASIVYVAGISLLSGGRGREPLGATFGFGLVHGLGFAGVLSGLGPGSGAGGVLLPLLGFNLGVEVGQLAIAGLVLPVLLSLRRVPVFGRVGAPACASLAGGIGLLWLVERTLSG